MQELMTITPEESECLQKVKTFKDIVFYYYKYHRHTHDDFFEKVQNFACWNELTQATKNKFDQDKDIESFKYDFNDKYYKPIHQKINTIKTIFNADLQIDFTDYEEVLFWYKIIIRMYAKKSAWDKIISINNSNRIGFIQAYNSLRSLSVKNEFLDEIDYFINNYRDMLLKKQSSYHPDDCYNNMIEVTNRDILSIISEFNNIDIKRSIDKLRILSTDDLVNSRSYRAAAKEYLRYLNRITDEVSNAVEKVNKEFEHIITFISLREITDNKKRVASNDIKTDVNLDSYDGDYILKQTIIEKLHETDYDFYKTLNMDTYESFINDGIPGLTDAQARQRAKKIRDDIKKIISESPRMIEYLYNHPGILLDLDIVCI